MNEPASTDDLPPRSERLLDRNRSLLLVVDLQTKLLPLISGSEVIAWNARRLFSAAKGLSVPMWVTEQYPEKLGPTVPLIDEPISASSKRMFSCRECHMALEPFRERGIRQVVICGIETHVCILQTALDLLADAWSVFVVVDSIGSRAAMDHTIAVQRMATEGVVVTTTESVLFEWCETSTAPEFRAISNLVRMTR